MTLSSLNKFGKAALEAVNCENDSFEAICLLEHCTGKNKTFIILHGNDKIPDEIVQKYNSLVNRRIQGEPLQYILGEWEFMGLKFNVGQGVLIPRPETEMLVELTVEELRNRGKTIVFDLCAGTGCIGISIASLCENAQVFLIEKSPEAMNFLTSNISKHKLANVKSFEGDILNGFMSFDLPEPDIVLSNPPYIPTEQLGTLQTEVQKEPPMALDGGIDGLCFYRALKDLWLPHCNPEGFMAVECGDGQAGEIVDIFSEKSQNIKTVKDLSGIERVVIAKSL